MLGVGTAAAATLPTLLILRAAATAATTRAAAAAFSRWLGAVWAAAATAAQGGDVDALLGWETAFGAGAGDAPLLAGRGGWHCKWRGGGGAAHRPPLLAGPPRPDCRAPHLFHH